MEDREKEALHGEAAPAEEAGAVPVAPAGGVETEAPEDAAEFMEIAASENLESTIVARVTDDKRMVMRWNGETIVSLSREFLNSNGAKKFTAVSVSAPGPEIKTLEHLDFATRMERLAEDLNICSQKGLVERFDSTIGAGTVLMPFGGASDAGATRPISPCKSLNRKPLARR